MPGFGEPRSPRQPAGGISEVASQLAGGDFATRGGLRATGETIRNRDPSAPELSISTLRKVFTGAITKLGITSRTGLARQLLAQRKTFEQRDRRSCRCEARPAGGIVEACNH